MGCSRKLRQLTSVVVIFLSTCNLSHGSVINKPNKPGLSNSNGKIDKFLGFYTLQDNSVLLVQGIGVEQGDSRGVKYKYVLFPVPNQLLHLVSNGSNNVGVEKPNMNNMAHFNMAGNVSPPSVPVAVGGNGVNDDKPLMGWNSGWQVNPAVIPSGWTLTPTIQQTGWTNAAAHLIPSIEPTTTTVTFSVASITQGNFNRLSFATFQFVIG